MTDDSCAHPLPYRRLTPGDLQYAIFRRSDDDSWQGLAGGGEDDETPIEAAHREAWEEARILLGATFVSLDTISSVPVTGFRDSHLWGSDRYVIEEHTFGVDMTGREIAISDEHTEYLWLSYSEARQMLRYDSNRTAL